MKWDYPKKRKILLAVVVVVIVIVCSSLVYFKYLRGITAKEGVHLADKIALAWSHNATLVWASGSGEKEEGRFSEWYYVYCEFSENNTPIREILVKVYDDGRTEGPFETVFSDAIKPPDYYKPIRNWVLDSDAACRIAKENNTIKDYMQRYITDILSFQLLGTNDSCIWYINWRAVEMGESADGVETVVNGTSGEVSLVKVRCEGPLPPPYLNYIINPYFECLVLPITVVIIIAVIVVLVIRKVFRWIIGGG